MFVLLVLLGLGVVAYNQPSLPVTSPLPTKVDVGVDAGNVISYKEKKGYVVVPLKDSLKPTPKTFAGYSVQKHDMSDSVKSCDQNLINPIWFKKNIFVLNSVNKEIVSRYAEVFKNCGVKEVYVTGYASPDGGYQWNILLAKKRALSVKSELEKGNKNLVVKVINPLKGGEISEKKVLISFN